MSVEAAVWWIGISHLIQPPLAFLLTRRIGMFRVLARCPPAIEQLGRNMALASIGLPTAMGVLLAVHAHEITTCPAARSLAWLVSAFWSWRLHRQWRAWKLGSSPFSTLRLWHHVLSLIFFIQGPTLGLVLVFSIP